MKTSPVIVIGAGIGGIAVAAHLAQRGLDVLVVEKNQRPGGRCDRLVEQGHCLDTGPTLLVMPLVYESELKALGASLHEALDLQRVDPTYRLVFDDGDELNLTSDLKQMYEQLERLEPGSFGGFLRYLEEGERHYRLAMERLVGRDFRHAAEFFTPANVPLVFDLKAFTRHYAHMEAFFTEPRLKAAFTFQDVYLGLSPFEAPATFSMMPYTELAHGVWFPRGGMYRVIEALMDIARRSGVKFAFDAEVTRIETGDERVTGVRLLDGRFIPADTVIANADLPYVYHNLLPEAGLARQYTRKAFSCSVISFFWGLDQTYEQLGPHTLFLVDDYRENFDSITGERTLPAHPSIYVHAPTRLDPALAPAGHDTQIVHVPVGHINETRMQNWPELREQARQAVFRRLKLAGIHDLESHLKFEINYTPLSWRKRYNLVMGSTHGLSHTLTQLGYLRPHNRHPRYHNLYFVGASTHPGTGVPTAMISARLTAKRVLDELAQ